MIGVVVVAAYPSVRAGLHALIAGEPGITVLATRADAGEEDGPDLPARPDALLVDVDSGRADLPARLARRFPEAGQVLLLDRPDSYRPPEGDVSQPWAALLKDAGADEITAALRAVMQGLVVLDPAIARLTGPRPALTARTDTADLEEPLTERESEVLQLLSLGLPNKGIAARLGISEHTAKFHVGSIMAKLGAASRTEAVAQAARRGLLIL